MLRFILHCKALNSLGAQPSPVAVTQGTPGTARFTEVAAGKACLCEILYSETVTF